jgi:C1A family cysteine protease
MRAILLVVAFAALAAAASTPLKEEEYQFLFSRWVEQHGKVYESVETFFKRFNIWKGNMNYIIAHSAKNSTYTLGMNPFGDLSNAEFKAQYNNYRPSAHRKRNIRKLHARAVPSSINWVNKGAVTPIKNQGQCGSCWAFSTTGSVEGAVFLKHHRLTSLSEQELVDCAGSTGNQGCNGGEMQDAMQWIIQNGGLCSEAAYPYTAQDGTCQSSTCTSVSTISSYVSVTPNSLSDLTTAVGTIGPISVAVDAGGMDWQFYSSGILSDACGDQLDHGVLAVGYGSGYWLVKNSWGTSWGESGYIQLQRTSAATGEGECGIAMDASYPIA